MADTSKNEVDRMVLLIYAMRKMRDVGRAKLSSFWSRSDLTVDVMPLSSADGKRPLIIWNL